MDLLIDSSDVTAFAREMRVAPQVVVDENTAAMNRAVLSIERRAKEVVPTDTHHLQRSITHEVSPRVGLEVVGRVGTNVPYGRVVEEGRRAGAAMPPSGVLLGWMRRHGVDASAEFVVRRAIGRRGIPARPYLSRALKDLEPQIRREFARVVPRIARRLGFR
jgi:Bacteriophage HK97-gp10, putative tail-component